MNTASPIPIPSGVIATRGTVTGFRTGGVTLDQGLPNGKIPLMIPSSAYHFGGTIAVGTYLQVVGAGSVHSGMTATAVSETATAPPSISKSGTVSGGTAYGFILNANGNHIPVLLTPAVVIAGGILEVGANATVTGQGSTGSSIVPAQIVAIDPTPTPPPDAAASPTPRPIAQRHIMSADYLGGYYGTRAVSWATAAQYLDWASTGVSDANAISAAGIKTMLYTNPNRTQSNDPMYTSDNSTFATDCSGHRITDVFNTTTQYVMNAPAASLASLYHSTIAAEIGTSHFDAVFEDDTGPLEEYGFTTLPCSYTDAAWMAGQAALANAAPAPVIFNGLSSLNGHNVSPSIAAVTDGNTTGGNFEHCYSDDSQPKDGGWFWTAVENTELQVNAANKLFMCMPRDTSAASTQTDARLYALASFLLTYNPATSGLWEGYGTTSGLHVMPEQQLVPLDPMVAAPADVSGLLLSGGAYGREYQHCYIGGQFVSACAVAVNPNPANTTVFPYPQYKHTMVLTGSGVADGGTMTTTGGPAPLYMPALSAYVVFP